MDQAGTGRTDEIGEFLAQIAARQPRIGELLRRAEADQQRLGYYHTLREICQQPLLWPETGDRLAQMRDSIAVALAGCRVIVLTGSGSSEYVGACLAPALQKELDLPVLSVGAGAVLLDARAVVPSVRPCMVVSFARSGQSPESVAVVEALLATEPEVRHLIITCNAEGELATRFAGDGRVQVVVLDDRTNDRGLAMTGSVTNMALAGWLLGLLDRPIEYRAVARSLATAGETILMEHAGALAELAGTRFRRAMYLGSGSRFGAAREAALKMMEMTAGRVVTMAETFLGVRHGPLAAIHEDTLVVALFSPSGHQALYEADVMREIIDKRLGAAKLLIGDVPRELTGENDLVIDLGGAALGEVASALAGVVAGQLLAFFRCMHEGLAPDSPSAGVINRVVGRFQIYKKAQPCP